MLPRARASLAEPAVRPHGAPARRRRCPRSRCRTCRARQQKRRTLYRAHGGKAQRPGKSASRRATTACLPTGISMMPFTSDAPPLILAEMVERRTRVGHPYFVGWANGLRVRLVHHGERTNADGEPVQVWRLVAQRCKGPGTADSARVLPFGCQPGRRSSEGVVRPAAGCRRRNRRRAGRASRFLSAGPQPHASGPPSPPGSSPPARPRRVGLLSSPARSAG